MAEAMSFTCTFENGQTTHARPPFKCPIPTAEVLERDKHDLKEPVYNGVKSLLVQFRGREWSNLANKLHVTCPVPLEVKRALDKGAVMSVTLAHKGVSAQLPEAVMAQRQYPPMALTSLQRLAAHAAKKSDGGGLTKSLMMHAVPAAVELAAVVYYK
jgi:hypothetical protein